MMKMNLTLLLLLLIACSGHPYRNLPECEGLNIEKEISFDVHGLPVVPRDWVVYYPECVNALVDSYGLDGFHAATFEERREFFGPEWEEAFRNEACSNRSWEGKPPSICVLPAPK